MSRLRRFLLHQRLAFRALLRPRHRRDPLESVFCAMQDSHQADSIRHPSAECRCEERIQEHCDATPSRTFALLSEHEFNHAIGHFHNCTWAKQMCRACLGAGYCGECGGDGVDPAAGMENQTAAEAVAELTKDGVDVPAFLERVRDAISEIQDHCEITEHTAREARPNLNKMTMSEWARLMVSKNSDTENSSPMNRVAEFIERAPVDHQFHCRFLQSDVDALLDSIMEVSCRRCGIGVEAHCDECAEHRLCPNCVKCVLTTRRAQTRKS